MSQVHVAMALRAALNADQGEAPARPEEQRAAARAPEATPELQEIESRIRSRAEATLAGIIGRSHDDWSRTVGSIRHVLESVQLACDVAVGQSPPDLGDATRELAASIVGTAAEAEAAARRARADAERISTELQGRIGALHGELDRVSVALKAAHAQVEEERRARGRVEAALHEALRVHDQLVAAHERDLRTIERNLERERADRDTVTDHVAAALRAALDSLDGEARTDPPAARRVGEDVERAGESRVAPFERVVSIDRTAPAIGPAGDARSAIEPRREPGAAFKSDLASFAQDLLVHAEAVYRVDVDAGRSPGELVNHLTIQLADAREQFLVRAGRAGDAAAAFKDHVIALLNTRSDSQFGRHLSIAIYELYGPDERRAAQA